MLCLFSMETNITLEIQGLDFNFLCLRENFLRGACLSMSKETVLENLLKISSTF